MQTNKKTFIFELDTLKLVWVFLNEVSKLFVKNPNYSKYVFKVTVLIIDFIKLASLSSSAQNLFSICLEFLGEVFLAKKYKC